MIDSLIKPFLWLCVAVGVVLAVTKSRWFLPAFIVSIVIVPLYQRQVTGSMSDIYDDVGYSRLLFEYLYLGLLAVFVVFQNHGSNFSAHQGLACKRLELASIAWLIINIGVVWFSSNLPISLALVLFGVIGPYFLFVTIARHPNPTQATAEHILSAVICGAIACMCIGGVFRYMKFLESGSEDLLYLRTFGNIYGGNAVDQLLAMLLPFAFAPKITLFTWLKFLRHGFAALTLLWTLTSFSRTGFATLAFGVLCAVLVGSSRFRIVLWLGGVTAVFVILGGDVLYALLKQFEDRFIGNQGSVMDQVWLDPRFDTWTEAFNIFMENPIGGVGVGNFIAHNSGLFSNAHNMFLNVLSERGILCLAVLLWVMISAILLARAFEKAFSRDPLATFSRSLGAGLVVFLLASQTGDDLIQSRGFVSAIKAYYLGAILGLQVLVFRVAMARNSNSHRRST